MTGLASLTFVGKGVLRGLCAAGVTWHRPPSPVQLNRDW